MAIKEKCCSTTNLVVMGLGAALVVFFAGVTAAVAAGEAPPTALWAAGGAVSGALIGILMPSPTAKQGHEAAARIAAKAGKTDAQANHEELAATTPNTSGGTVLALAIIFIAMLALSIVLAAGVIHPTSPFDAGPLTNISKAVLALASASGSALVGIYTPTKEG